MFRSDPILLLWNVKVRSHSSPNEKTKAALSRSYGVVAGDFSTIIETRRLSARPSGLSEPSVFLFGAIGYCSPNPFVETFAAKTPLSLCTLPSTKSRPLFIGGDNEALSVVAKRICNPDRSLLGING